MKAIVGGTVYTPDRKIPSGVVLVDGASVRAVGADIAVPEGAERIDATGMAVIPGLVDVHTHGLLGHNMMGPALADAIGLLPRYGVTSFMATTLTQPHEVTVEMLAAMDAVLRDPPRGADCLGIHIEGPYLARSKPGMAVADWTEPLSWERFQVLQDAAGGRIRMVTFAPEAGEAMQAIPRLVESGVIPVVGHSDATFEQAAEAFRLGSNQVTHTFNAMSPLRHREPGVVGAVMYFPDVYAELVADGIHVHPVAMAILVRVKGLDRVVTISDAAPVAGLPNGSYDWGGQTVYVRDGRCELENGTIAGAHALLDTGLRQLVNAVGLPLEEALVTVTRTPADSVGASRKGRLEPGADADVVLLDADLRPVATFVSGESVWQRA